jgi:hypothetical protein
MLNLPFLEIKDKAWQRADVSSVTQVLLLFRSTVRPILKKQLLCETTRDQIKTAPKFGA